MPSSQSLQSFVIADPRFYEPLGSAQLSDDLAAQILDRIGSAADVTTGGIWTYCRPGDFGPLPDHGWKIHISATPADAGQAADIICREYHLDPFSFKILRATELVFATVSRWWPRGSAGKVITVYSRSPEECRRLLPRLAAAFAPVRGSYVLSDRRYGSSGVVYYRYGEFRPVRELCPDGRREAILYGPGGSRWPDLRLPTFRLPPWTGDLFTEPDAAGGPAPASPARGSLDRYRILKPLHQSTAGGVYLAEDLTTGQEVVLKEARPHTAFSPDGADAIARLRREYASLKQLELTGAGPRPIELAEAWEHLFLAEEKIEGLSLRAFTARRNPLVQGDMSEAAVATYREEMRTVLAGARRAIAACHAHGLVYGDLSPTNVIIDPDTLDVRLIDFEATRPFDAPPELYPRTRGFSPCREAVAAASGQDFDRAGLAGVELALIAPRNDLIDLNHDALIRSTRHAAGLLGWPLSDVFERLGLSPAETTQVRPDPAVDDGSLRAVIEDGVGFITGTMTPDRTDRLFPADPAMFAANPFGLANGAAGVIRALHRLTGTVPGVAMDWLGRHLPPAADLPPGLLYGWAGVASCLIDVGETERGCGILDRIAAGLDEVTAADIATGLAGVGTAFLGAWLRTGAERYREAAVCAGRALARRARDDGTGLHWPDPTGPAPTVGYPHGSSGIATFLLYLHCAAERGTGRAEFLRLGRRALQYDLGQARPRRVGIGFPGKIGARPLEPYWASGAAGVGAAALRYLRVTGEERLRTLTGQFMPSTLSGISLNPGLFLGMAGLANLALDHDYLLGGDQYRGAARNFATSILVLRCPQPEGLAFPGNSLLRYSVDYATGSAGILLLLHRLVSGGPDFNLSLDELLPDLAPAGVSTPAQEGKIQHD